MEGLTDPIMRDVLTHIGSFDWCVTEFIRVTNSVLPDHVYHSYCPELLTEGKTAAGRHPVSPWGQPTKGFKTRNNKRTNSYIVKGRPRGKQTGTR